MKMVKKVQKESGEVEPEMDEELGYAVVKTEGR